MRDASHLPVVGSITLGSEFQNMLSLALHEIGQVLGIGTACVNTGFVFDKRTGIKLDTIDRMERGSWWHEQVLFSGVLGCMCRQSRVSAVAQAVAKVATKHKDAFRCGVEQRQETVYVVAPEGRIIRTIDP